MTNIHVVFPKDYIEVITQELQKSNYQVTNVDYTFETFHHYAMSEEALIDTRLALIVDTLDSNIPTEAKAQEYVEKLTDIRIKHPNLRIVLILPSAFTRITSLAQKLVTLGVYDIYFCDEMTPDDIISWLNHPKTIADMKNLILSDQHFDNQINTSKTEKANITKDNHNDLEEKKSTGSRVKNKELQKHLIVLNNIEDEIIETPIPVQKEIIVNEKIIGTIFIAVTSVTNNIGSTHFSIQLASFLKRKGQKVAIVEANYSQDFRRIQAMYEGEHTTYRVSGSGFSIENIDHYLITDSFALAELIHRYEFVILDMGEESNAAYFEEFYRAHIKIVVASASEWKHHLLKEFSEKHRTYLNDTCKVVVPFATHDLLSDLQKCNLNWEYYTLPSHVNPYEPQKDTDAVMESMLREFLPSQKKGFTKGTVIFASIASSLIVSLILLAFLFFE